jgi:hypothetical protein
VIFGHEADGTCWLGPPKPDWHLPHPGGSRPQRPGRLTALPLK